MISTVTPRLLCLLSSKLSVNNCRTVFATRTQRLFYEPDEKSGYARKSDYKEPEQNTFEQIRQGYKYFIEEMKLFKGEMVEKFSMDPVLINRIGEVDVQWKFDGDPTMLEKWVVTADSDYGEGNSAASLQLSPRGRGVFSGELDPRVMRDGKIKVTGYCNLKSVILRRSFQRQKHLDWGTYSHLVMRIRGDGRNYLLALMTPGEWDLLWNDSYQYVLYTRGGPYWQYVRIPFSKFFLSSKGRIQDTQQPVPLQNITCFGITASDKIPGHFKLEIDYIGIETDPVMDEEHAYEMYRPPHKYNI